MIGAIVGDFVGSAYEFAPTKDYNFKLVTPASSITDDSIMSLAIADALMQPEPDYMERMLYYGRKYPNPVGGYSGSFARWLASNDPQPYNSYGNGSAMRVAAIGWAYSNLETAQAEAAATAEVTHNHTEGIRGAVAVATAVNLARRGYTKDSIRKQVERLGYDLDFTIVGIKRQYKFDETCMGTVPVAIQCFLDSIDYVDCIRMAVSLGGDADTLACIAGAIAEAHYGADTIPSFLVEQALVTLPTDLLGVYMEFKKRFCYQQ